MEVHLPQDQVAQLNELAAKTGRGADDLLQEAVAKLLSHNEWFKQQVQIGIEQIARGEFMEENEMDARVERMLRTSALVEAVPNCGCGTKPIGPRATKRIL
ncbi:MAG: ribbon-helix-helix domain-containing protein [Acidobacteriia bacterium]|nr:ribbon-helix-helix domain-containing protein [Terriglobia bacterium]